MESSQSHESSTHSSSGSTSTATTTTSTATTDTTAPTTGTITTSDRPADAGADAWTAPECEAGYSALPVWAAPGSETVTGYNLVTDATHVYFLTVDGDFATGQLTQTAIRLSVADDAVTTIGAVPESDWDGVSATMAIDSQFLYWSTNEGLIVRAPLGGGTPTTLFGTTALEGLGGFNVDDGSVYALGVDTGTAGEVPPPAGYPPSSGTLVLQVGPDGGAPVQLADVTYTAGEGAGVAVDANNVYVANLVQTQGATGCGGGCYQITYYVDILSIPRGGGYPTTLYETSPWPQEEWTTSIAVDDSFVYFSDRGQLARVPLGGYTGGNYPEVLATSPRLTGPFAFDGTSLYWGSGHAILKVAKSGGPVTTLCTLGATVGACAADATGVDCTIARSPGYYPTGIVRVSPK